jgi:chaperonin GroES
LFRRLGCLIEAKYFHLFVKPRPFWYNKLMVKKKNNAAETTSLETVEPIGKRVLIRKDEDKKQTKGGIQLPDNIEIPTITGRVVAISAEVENSPDIPLRQYDKVLFNPKGAIPVDFEGNNRLFVVEVGNVVAVFRRT